ncbi:LTA synthase family protein [Paenibacillus sp. CC-CFT747]|nr:LTA synthase family protein [Paenibacillus sp. CC-CFT747]
MEFEVLSGNSIRFLPQGSLAYIQYVNHEVDSLASILDRQDYNTVSVNPFHNWFFDSNKVYKDFGFGKFISSEFFDSGVNGLYIPDTKVSEVIINEAQKSKGPDFIFANTMENHWPYEPWKFGNNNHFKVLNSYSEETKGIIETYAQGVHNAEQSLKMMVDHFSKTKEPTIIVFFGDHLPLLGNEYGVYKETGYLTENDPDFLKKMYSTPFVVWNNYLPEKKETLNINPSFLGPYVLNLAERKGSYYTDYLYQLSKKMPIIPPKNHYEEMNIKEEDLTEYKLLQHDILFGSRYGYKDISEPIIHKDYVLGFGDMKIESVDSEVLASPDSQGESDTPVEIHGHFFVPGSIVYLGDKPLKTTYHDEAHLTATIPKALLAKKGKKMLQVEVYDSKKIAIAKSNPFELAAK